jgi:hypothetical protein
MLIFSLRDNGVNEVTQRGRNDHQYAHAEQPNQQLYLHGWTRDGAQDK